MYVNHAYTAQFVAHIHAPKQSSISRKAIQTFFDERANYEAAVDAQPGLIAISCTGSFDALLLPSLGPAGIFGTEITNVLRLSKATIKARIQSFTQMYEARFV